MARLARCEKVCNVCTINFHIVFVGCSDPVGRVGGDRRLTAEQFAELTEAMDEYQASIDSREYTTGKLVGG